MSVDDLLPGTPEPGEGQQLYAGVVLDTPADVDDEVRVRLNTDTDQYVGPMHFMPRDTTLPESGDSCLVAFDQDGKPWLIAWF